MTKYSRRIFCGDLLSPSSLAASQRVGSSFSMLRNAAIVVENGHISDIVNRNELPGDFLNNAQVVEFGPNQLIVPGFVDTHIHYPQVRCIAMPGGALLPWLNELIYPEEIRYSDPEFAAQMAELFFQEVLRNGTTTVSAFCTIYDASVDAFFNEARKYNIRAIAGKVLMDRNVPVALMEDAETSISSTRRLIERWHRNGRFGYAITPRFAPACSNTLLEQVGRLLGDYQDVYFQTHLSENVGEIKLVGELFPEASDYTDVYRTYGLLTDRSVFAHAIHLSRHEIETLATHRCALAHCPHSNLYLGSGEFDFCSIKRTHPNLRIALGTDVAAGPSFSMLRTMGEAYKVAELRGQHISPERLMLLGTLDGAKALNLDDKIGSIEVGKEADFAVLNLTPTPLLTAHHSLSRDIWDDLFSLMLTGDDRAIAATIVDGEIVYENWPAASMPARSRQSRGSDSSSQGRECV